MSGTDSSRADGPLPPAPAVVLVNPQLGENIGGCARAMLNCGLTDLRLVKPRDGWPNPVAKAMAVGAVSVLDTAKVFETTAEACADLSFVFATTARSRDMMKPVFTPRAAVPEMRTRIDSGQAVGLMFGPERSGLANDDLVVADAILNVPLNPAFSSLNLAQAVLLIGYEWWQSTDATPDVVIGSDHEPAQVHLRQFFLDRLERELESRNYFHPPQTAPIMKQNLRVMLTRAGFSEDELSTLHGVLKSLTTRAPKA